VSCSLQQATGGVQPSACKRQPLAGSASAWPNGQLHPTRGSGSTSRTVRPVRLPCRLKFRGNSIDFDLNHEESTCPVCSEHQHIYIHIPYILIQYFRCFVVCTPYAEVNDLDEILNDCSRLLCWRRGPVMETGGHVGQMLGEATRGERHPMVVGIGSGRVRDTDWVRQRLDRPC
jgi:hypothetical protein